MSQKYLNIRKLEIPEIISNNIFLYRNFRYELLTKKYRAIRALAQVQAIYEAIHDRRRCIEYYYIFDTIRYIFHIRIHIVLFGSLVGNSTLLYRTMRSMINVFCKGKYCLNCLKTFLNLMYYPIYI